MPAPIDDEREPEALVGELKRFSDTVIDLKRRRNEYLIALLVAVGIIALLVGWIMFVQNPRTDRLAHRVESNTQTITSVQCSLYRLVLTSGYHPETRIKPDDTLEEQIATLAVYNEQYRTIVRDNNRLGCTAAPEPTEYISDPTKVTTTTRGINPDR